MDSSTERSIDSLTPGTYPSKANPYLKVEDVSVTLEKNEILKSFSLNIYPDEVVSLLGPSGCGKTTLLRSITGFVPIKSGKIFLKKKLIQSPTKSVAPAKRNMSMVFQDYALFPHLNVRENINFSKPTFSKKSSLFQELIEGLKIENLLKKYPYEISGGQQQRVAIARSVINKPGFLLMDEPFANQDVELKEKVMEVIYNVLKKEKVTSIIATHDQNVALKFSNKIAVIKDKCLEEINTPFNIFHYPKKHFTANFFGDGVFIKAKLANNTLFTAIGRFSNFKLVSDNRITKQNKTSDVAILLRANDIKIDHFSNIKAIVVGKYFQGGSFIYKLQLRNQEIIISSMPYQQEFHLKQKVGIKLNTSKQIIAYY